MKIERSLVTGGAGFIGSHLCEYLLERGQEVICIDNLSTGSKANVAHLIRSKRFKFLKKDVTNKIKIIGKLDYIYHLASPASPVDYQKLAIETLLVNSLGTRNTLELAREKKARYLLASSSEVYGDPRVHPQHEEYWGNVNPIGARSCYDEAKRFAEALTMAYHRKYNLDIRIARIFNTYGPRMRLEDGRAVPNFIAQAIANKP
ncbi:MAG: GDP-mannose 4,6-dehydratase, partial [Methanocellales archaeon]